MKRELYICLPVYNEEKHLERCLNSINNATSQLNNYFIKTILCLNGCKDNSLKIAKECIKKYPFLNIKILNSQKGKLAAQEKMLLRVPSNKIVFFIDADTEIDKNSIRIILEEIEKHKELIVVGAFPVARNYNGLNFWKRLMDRVLNIRSRHPMCEISKLSVREYHSLALTDPQKINTSQEHEIKSKIFFHGRMFALRSKKYWHRPKKNKGVVGDDSYLPDFIITNYGKNRIRIRYDAIVYFEPFTVLKNHYIAYKRIYFDLKNLKDNFPEFENTRAHSELVLDSNYIQNQNYIIRFYFFMFKIIRRIEKYLFNFSAEKNPHLIWKKN